MADKNYYGKCGSCKHCDLGNADRYYSTPTFKCLKISNCWVKADQTPDCTSSYEPDLTRSNDTIERYVRGY